MIRGISRFLSGLVPAARSSVAGYLLVVVAVAVTSWVVGSLEAATQVYDASLLYLLVILGAAILYGTGPAVVAALVAVVLFDWFLEPVGTLVPSGPSELLALLLFLTVGVVAGQLAAGQRRRAEESLEREQEATTLSTINSLIVSTSEPSHFVREVLDVLPGDLSIEGLALLVPDDSGSFSPLATAGQIGPVTAAEWRVAEEVFKGGPVLLESHHVASHAREISSIDERSRNRPMPDSNRSTMQLLSLYVSVRASDRPIGVLRICRGWSARDLTSRQCNILGAVGQQFGIAIERGRLQAEAAEAEVWRQAEELKTSVLQSVTHDLRTPLAVIKAAAGNLHLRGVEWTDEEKDSFVVSIEKNVDRLDSIVGNLLDLSRIEAGLARPERQYYPLIMLVDDLIGRLQPLLGNYPVTVDVSDDLPPVPVDYVSIDRVLSNLIENAIRHTPAGTAIRLSAAPGHGEIIVSVADDGPGIPESVLPHVFERFYRGEVRRSEARSGIGLGLAVAKGLVEAHNGRIWAESSVGEGARFFFTLPLHDDANPASGLGLVDRASEKANA